MAGTTNTGESAFLNSVLRGLITGTPLANAGDCFITLHKGTGEPGELADFTDHVGDFGTNNYTAQQCTFGITGTSDSPSVPSGTSSVDSTLTNVGVITFTSNATGTWGTVHAYGVHLSASAGTCSADNMIISGVWTDDAVVTTGDTVQIAAGALIITCA